MDDDLPYMVEYAKSDRSKCQLCKQSIMKTSLRLAAVVQSPVHDGKIPRWYHFKCFFSKQRPSSTNDIACFDQIRNQDQDAIQKKIEECRNAPSVSKGRKRTKGGASGDFRVEYAKSSRSTCIGCQEKIIKGETRIAKKDYESEDARKFGGLDRWLHVECFVKLRADMGYYGRGDELPGAKQLSKEDQAKLKASLPKMNQGDMPPPPKKVKDEPEDAEEAKLIKKQNDELYAIKDKISRLGKKEMIELLEENDQGIPSGTSNIISLLTDMLYFGALQPCPKCNGQFIYNSGLGYKCTGNATEWSKCEYVTQDPKRKLCEIPIDMEAFPIKSYKSKIRKRIFKITMPSSSGIIKKEEDEADGPKIQGKPRPLKNMQFVILGRTQKDKEELKREILLLGGTVVTKIHQDLAAVISNQNEVDKMNKRMEDVKSHDIQVITEDFIEEAKEYTDSPIMLLKKKTISSWGGDINARLSNVITKSASKSKSKFEKSGSGKMKVKVKGGGAVDPDSGLEDVAHIYQKGKDKYTVTLGLTNIQSKKNSYYKLQILKHDKHERYHLFRSWGRIGTTIGGNKLDGMSLEECIEQFESLYEEKTGNRWKNREHFVKVPNLMYPIDIDHGDQEVVSLDSDIKSNLQKPIQDLIRLIFDVDEMKKVMLEFEIDLDKMPLGKLSKKQIEKAYAVLTELQEVLKITTDDVDRATLVDASNRFYTLIPHNFGISGPKVLGSLEEIKIKCDMLDALLEMEVAYNLLCDKTNEKENPLDSHYKQLKTDIEVMDKTSEEFKMIEKYVKNTHADTHKQYELEIKEVFIIKRQGEEQRFKPFKKLPNRKLLWHGSRTTNYAGILSQGLRIAPPEAPVTGYMFGKGIYFADMVSKSANYCCTHSQNPTGLLLLCEVALGNMYEKYQADYIEKLPKGKHSTLGRGQTQPDPQTVHKTKDGVEVPYGKGISAKLNNTSALLYNEYIVYDVAQVKVRYLVKMNFKYKY
ncbi:PREDICTED: poly [ADP-ribose] polymerase [Trachymyrmex cornetzi]|uniref:Poly [ADP-ribose] polymerase n=1 Tax=Trachymyrmex cornetzi TaxID=471704 RepID=A0A195DLT0_9HYME|nr:PREDICTED: poly [ADP-ribose] polymerase [Trachymyrmex cornetzi]KYN13833.1 Poly [ADP-ribose] polymerase [Trachymyrmex cornetzi]